MRTENIEVTFKIPIPVDKPNLNSIIYSKEAIKNIKNIPIEVLNNDGQFLPIRIAQEVELIKDENSVYITGIGLIRERDRQIRVQAINDLIAKYESAKFDGFDDGECHTCGHSVSRDCDGTNNFCPDCGQKLDWSDEE